jgi:SAM-dependent methyltransferase
VTDAPPSEAFVEHVASSACDGSFVRLVLSSPTTVAHPARRIVGRLISLRGQAALSLTFEEQTRALSRNLELNDVPQWLRHTLGAEYRSALLETVHRDWQLSIAAPRRARLTAHRPRSSKVPARTHDRLKRRNLDASADDWLTGLGLLDGRGRVSPRRADKFHQVMRYAEILRHLMAQTRWPPGARLHVADMGCGRGHLTFAAWQLLRRQLGFNAEVLGIETRPELVSEAGRLTQRLGIKGLQFIASDIAAAPLRALDVLIALHACNTATDHAILRGVEQGARLIVVAPCCHKEIRPQMGRPEPLGPVLRHGIMTERLSEWATDALRALFLEAAGYRVKVIEFVPSEHTPKNLLIAGVHSDEAMDHAAARERIAAFKRFFGIQRHSLDALLSAP